MKLKLFVICINKLKMLKEINAENLEERIILTSVNQAWFKFLALITFICNLVVYAALIWLIVCRN